MTNLFGIFGPKNINIQVVSIEKWSAASEFYVEDVRDSKECKQQAIEFD